MDAQSIISDWQSIIYDLQISSNATAIGVYSLKEELLEANAAMAYFLALNKESNTATNKLINPTLEQLLSVHKEGKIFEGMLTIGNYSNISYTFDAKVFRKSDQLLVYCETDAPHLFSENKKMSRLNQEVNNLQRQLIKEKGKLQHTLNELKNTQQMLIHAEKMSALGKLVAGIAHEINNPIAFVYSNIYSIEENVNDLIESFNEIEKLLKSSGEGKFDAEIDRIRKNHEIDFVLEDLPDMTLETKKGIDRVKVIVEDLRKFSRLDESEVKIIDLIENLHSTLVIVGSAIKEKKIHCSIVGPEKLYSECYPGQLNQALLNIIMNAVQAVDEGGIIIIELKEDDNSIIISINDNGPGIPEHLKDKIFEPFFTTKAVGSGTGLGLSISYKIIHDLHKGSLLFDSEAGQGTTFKMIIPKNIVKR